MNSVVENLNDIYFSHEDWQGEKLSSDEITKYHEALIQKGRISVYAPAGKVLGYVESWRINFEQFGRLVCGETISAYLEDVETGPIAYCANVWVDPEWRQTSVIKFLRTEFFRSNFQCQYFVGHALRKGTQPIKVFKRNDRLVQRFIKGDFDGC